VTAPTDPETRPATAGEAGRTCPYCRFAFKEGAPLSLCPTCHAAHHEECWSDNGGCAMVGCTSSPPAWRTRPQPAEAAAARAGTAPPPPPPPVLSSPTMQGAAPPPSPPRGRRLSPLAAVLIVGALAAAGAGGAVIATRGHDPAAASAGTTASPVAQTTPTTPGTETVPADDPPADDSEPDPSEPTPAADRAAIAGVLHRYEDAYSTHSLSGLRAIMSPSVTRHGLRSGGCDDTTGRADVLQAYAEQFANGTGTYTLHGSITNAVQLTGSSATVPLTYSIGGGGSGSVRFDLRRFPVGWQISHIQASC
jgi:hypothetical protein